MQTASGGPLFPWQQNTEWVDNWKFRTTPASRSRVLSGKYKLVQRDNDVILLSGENKGYFPMGDKTFNSYISDNTYTPEQMNNFRKSFILRYGNTR